ncbi:MBL fold metallo-hydrolase [Streptomyces decoyicus]|uniref:MBL fold metallo-hydrolase n=1 Tax=Streptomyces decoyicus TaxID=249567 RepID=UPI00386E11AD
MGMEMTVRRLDLGYFIRPASETGGPQPRVEPVLAYLVRHDRGLLLFDTGIGNADSGTEAHYRPQRRPLQGALSAAGVTPADISVVVNCQAALQGVEPPLPAYPHWLERLADFDPRRVLFAHDCSVWEPADSNRADEQGSPHRG